MKRVIRVVLTVAAYVEMSVPATGESDVVEAAEDAARSAIPSDVGIYIFGEDHDPAEVHLEIEDVTIDGEEEISEEGDDDE